MAVVGQGLSVAGGPGPGPEPSTVKGATAQSPIKEATAGASKGAGKAPGAAAAAKSEKSSGSPQRHGIQKTMSK